MNQTRHKIYLSVNTIVPFISKTIEVKSTVPIAETIIVGRVPDNYTNVPEKDFLNVVSRGND
ncbi:MAG: sporulation protein YunB [Maledivibacter sp.]|nr:sporulation protein YunB [Maledivibacter sp.]